MDREGVEAVYLAYFGTDHPEAHGIRFQALPGYGRVGDAGGEIDPGRRAAARRGRERNLLLGMFLNEPDTYAWLREREPTAVLGGSLYVFDLTGDPPAVERVRTLPRR